VFNAGNLEQLVATIRTMTDNRLMLSLMAESARAFVMAKAPDTATTYSTILQPGFRELQGDPLMA
jgi:hypothetical protein